MQPTIGSEGELLCKRMKGKRKTNKVPGFMRHVLAENVAGLMALHFKESRNRPKALSVRAGVSLSTVQRVLGAKTGASLDNIEAIAEVFDLSAYQLLIPALEIARPQTVQGAMKNEERMFRQWKKSGVPGRAEQPALERSSA